MPQVAWHSSYLTLPKLTVAAHDIREFKRIATTRTDYEQRRSQDFSEGEAIVTTQLYVGVLGLLGGGGGGGGGGGASPHAPPKYATDYDYIYGEKNNHLTVSRNISYISYISNSSYISYISYRGVLLT